MRRVLAILLVSLAWTVSAGAQTCPAAEAAPTLPLPTVAIAGPGFVSFDMCAVDLAAAAALTYRAYVTPGPNALDGVVTSTTCVVTARPFLFTCRFPIAELKLSTVTPNTVAISAGPAGQAVGLAGESAQTLAPMRFALAGSFCAPSRSLSADTARSTVAVLVAWGVWDIVVRDGKAIAVPRC